ncbi:MAG: T9SS type A sorting domain-containing protein [Bacteroidales bacterium]|nr:T9SS type A sorting domain-containing protein [Bacteroidales bacterium]
MKKSYLLLIIAVTGILSYVLLSKNSYDKEIAKSYTKEKSNQLAKHIKADKPDMFTQFFKDITTKIGYEKSGYKMSYKTIEYKKALNRAKNLNLNKVSLPWIQRGPANIGGRTRAIIVDPDDATHNTWFAGAATGGIWKTTDAGSTWTNLSGDITNLSVNTLVMAESNTNIIYAGTGESFTGNGFKGNGVWKSTDKGATWNQLSSTATDENFAYINRLIVSPVNENIVLAATQTGIFKSADGGASWTNVYSSSPGVEDLTADPTNFNILFAGENSRGVLRSTDAGNTWLLSSNGIGSGKRFEVTVSNVDNNYVYTSTELSSTESSVYFSTDNGINWKKYNDPQNFLGGQGWYDNTITAHPYIADEVFVGGVDIWKLKFNGTESTSTPEILGAYTENTDFLSFINFGGAYLDGGMSSDEGTDLVASDWTSIEIRFGPGLTQKAHRFTVPTGSTSGVAPSSYTYEDYIDVPFQVWDTDNNIQLMVSFRDQENDGAFNLYERTGDAYGELGREYIFVNSVAYNTTTPDANISTAGGHLYKNLYMFWPILTTGATWDAANLPSSKIVVQYGSLTLITGVKTSIADAYGNYGGPNGYLQSSGFGTTSIPGLHPDHHNITIIPTGDPNFIMIDGNDGGFGVSYDNGVTIDQIPNNYITTQFYGAAKHPSANEYFGGMQDNGTWQSPSGEDATSNSDYYFRIGGDGFECLWHTENPDLMLGSIYYNKFYRSSNGGSSWALTTGITTDDGPFISKLSVSKEEPNTVFAVSNSGVYKSINFGQSWNKKIISTNWAIDGTVASAHNVEVSPANGKIVWAGGGMATDYGLQMQVSTDYGNSFTALPDYNIVDMNAYISGIATHPIDKNTAYVLFSLSDKPKILRTTDLGQTWTDISGFGTGNESTNGFPDVVTHCLLVMPHEPNTIWAGTDIGLFESTDNGVSWHIANNGLPPVSIYDMHISGNQVVVATHGRGIWTVDIAEIDNIPFISSFSYIGTGELEVVSDFQVSYDSVEVYINNAKDTTLQSPVTGTHNIVIDMNLSAGTYTSNIIGYIGAQPYYSNILELVTSGINLLSKAIKSINVYPNPSSDIINFVIDNKESNLSVRIYNTKGQLVLYEESVRNNQINISGLRKGTYIINIKSKQENYSQIIQKN